VKIFSEVLIQQETSGFVVFDDKIWHGSSDMNLVSNDFSNSISLCLHHMAHVIKTSLQGMQINHTHYYNLWVKLLTPAIASFTEEFFPDILLSMVH